MRYLKTTDKNFKESLKEILHRGGSTADDIERQVKEIIQRVRKEGNSALFEYTKKFDHFPIHEKNLEVTKSEIKAAYKKISSADLKALKLAADRIKKFHQKISLKSWRIQEKGVTLGQQVTPLKRVGIYVPGGKAAYPSSVLMNAIPARVAGVEEVLMVTPFREGKDNPHVLVAADLAGVHRIFKVGGAQSVAALAYGTESIPHVDKIVGPGNIYVATAKQLVFGTVDIDMIAGPSEILVICDGKTDPDWIAADLLSQAEHDEEASSILLTWNEKFIEQVSQSIEKILKELPRAAIAKQSLENHGILILTRNEKEAAELSNEIAPEHLELSVQNPKKLLKQIRNAGAIFLGRLTTESFGDYLAGPNHVLPTNGTARFSSPLSTLDFLKFSSVIECSKEGVRKLGSSVVHLAELEGLQAHALAMKLRLKKS